MLSTFLSAQNAFWEFRGSPAGPSLEGFARQLCQIGYSNRQRLAGYVGLWEVTFADVNKTSLIVGLYNRGADAALKKRI